MAEATAAEIARAQEAMSVAVKEMAYSQRGSAPWNAMEEAWAGFVGVFEVAQTSAEASIRSFDDFQLIPYTIFKKGFPKPRSPLSVTVAICKEYVVLDKSDEALGLGKAKALSSFPFYRVDGRLHAEMGIMTTLHAPSLVSALKAWDALVFERTYNDPALLARGLFFPEDHNVADMLKRLQDAGDGERRRTRNMLTSLGVAVGAAKPGEKGAIQREGEEMLSEAVRLTHGGSSAGPLSPRSQHQSPTAASSSPLSPKGATLPVKPAPAPAAAKPTPAPAVTKPASAMAAAPKPAPVPAAKPAVAPPMRPPTLTAAEVMALKRGPGRPAKPATLLARAATEFLAHEMAALDAAPAPAAAARSSNPNNKGSSSISTSSGSNSRPMKAAAAASSTASEDIGSGAGPSAAVAPAPAAPAVPVPVPASVLPRTASPAPPMPAPPPPPSAAPITTLPVIPLSGIDEEDMMKPLAPYKPAPESPPPSPPRMVPTASPSSNPGTSSRGPAVYVNPALMAFQEDDEEGNIGVGKARAGGKRGREVDETAAVDATAAARAKRPRLEGDAAAGGHHGGDGSHSRKVEEMRRQRAPPMPASYRAPGLLGLDAPLSALPGPVTGWGLQIPLLTYCAEVRRALATHLVDSDLVSEAQGTISMCTRDLHEAIVRMQKVGSAQPPSAQPAYDADVSARAIALQRVVEAATTLRARIANLQTYVQQESTRYIDFSRPLFDASSSNNINTQMPKWLRDAVRLVGDLNIALDKLKTSRRGRVAAGSK